MKRYTYRPISEAPRDGTVIAGVCGGVETLVCWDDPLPGVLEAGWYHWDDEEFGPSHQRVRDQPSEWRELPCLVGPEGSGAA